MAGARLGAFILAAGFSSRMPAFKPLLHLQGRSLLEWTANLWQQAGIEQITVLVGHRAEEVCAEAKRLGLSWLHNPDPAQGMFSSVRLAAQAARPLDGFFLLPVDIPLVRPATIHKLLVTYKSVEDLADKPVLYPTFQGQRGHPPLIPNTLLDAILDYSGPGGLQALLERYPGQDVPVWDRGILLDADTPDDFAVLKAKALGLTVGEVEEVRVLAELFMPKRGLAHGRAVAKVALRLGQALNQKGSALDLALVHNAALVHDIAKGEPEHEKRGGALLTKLGLTGLAEIVASHRDVIPPASGVLTAKEVVCLADKVVRCDQRVLVTERFGEKLSLYAHDEAACTAIRGRLQRAKQLQLVLEEITGQSLEEILAGVLA